MKPGRRIDGLRPAPPWNTTTGAVRLRTLTGVTTLGVVLALLWLPHAAARMGFTVFVAGIAGIGLHEYAGIARARGIAVDGPVSVVLGVLVVVAAHFGDGAWMHAAAYGGFVVLAGLQIARGRQSVAEATAAAFGLFYVGWFAGHFLLTRTAFGPAGPGLVTLLLAVVALTDTAAYFVGRTVGRHKLTPISPKKTWEGAVGGFVFAMIGVGLMYYLRRYHGWRALPAWGPWQYAVAGATLSIVAQVGDLCESMLKRDAGLKDSGNFFPGHGGVLDRCDGFLFAAPAMYYMTEFFNH